MTRYYKYVFLVLAVIFLLAGFFIFIKLKYPKLIENTVGFDNNDINSFQSENYIHKASNFTVDLVPVADPQIQGNQIYAMVAPHHLVAGSLINQAYAGAAASFAKQNKKVENIVLISPNHFQNPKKIITSDASWQTHFGEVKPELDLISLLTGQNYAQIDYLALEKEHGISSHLPFIKNYFPETKILPLILHDDLTADEKNKLADFLCNRLGDGSLIVISADFSHYLPQEAAYFHDQASLAALYNLDQDFSGKMDIDSQTSLAVLFSYLSKKQAEKFIFLDNKNSQDFISEFLAETTSYITGYYVSGGKETQSQQTWLFLGDMMLDRQVYQLTKKAGNFAYPFLKMDLFLKGVDYRLANLEGPITNNESRAVNPNDLIFTFSPSFLPFLAQRFEILNLANNHGADFGQTGLDQTRNYLTDFGILALGDPYNRQANLSLEINKNNIKVCLFSYNQNPQTGAINILTELKKSDCDFKIVYAHWGNEYETGVDPAVRQLAREFIESSADLVLGSHPHVVGPVEEYRGKLIFYSLGNFVFDQYFSEDVKTGLAVGLILNKDYNKISRSFRLFPFRISNQSQPQLLLHGERQDFLDNLSDLSSGLELKKALKSGIIIK